MAAKVGLPPGDAAGADAEPFFNGLHLRLEADAAAWIATAGGQQRFWDRRAYFPLRGRSEPTVPMLAGSISSPQQLR